MFKLKREDALQELKVTWLRAATVWWAFVWRSLLIGFGIGFVAALLVPLFGMQAGGGWFTLLLYLLLIPIGIWLFRLIMTKPFNGFRIALVPVIETTEDSEITGSGLTY